MSTKDAKVLDAKFADDSSLLILLQVPLEDKTMSNVIVSLPYTLGVNSMSHEHPIVTYTPLPHASVQQHLLPQGTPPPSLSRNNIAITRETIERHTRHVFEGRFTPLRLEVNGRKGRRVIVVLGSDRKHYRVLDMDFRMKKDKDSRDDVSWNGSDSEAEDGDGDVGMGGA